MTSRRFIKRPLEIEAARWEPGDYVSVGFMWNWLQSHGVDFDHHDGGSGDETTLSIQTLEGRMTAQPGDWIIKGIHGEFYPCKPDIFAATYEEIT